jgi:cytochrome b6-f complex iron-sulfur subunit
MQTSMKRREFIHWMSVGAIASSLPVAIAACSENNTQAPVSIGSPLPVPPNAVAGGAVGTMAALDQAGFLNVTVDGKPTIVVRDPNNKTNIIAVNAMCTHKGCTVAWNPEQKAHVCPCHGAAFAASGKVSKGPAEKPLTAYTVKVEGDNILVQV